MKIINIESNDPILEKYKKLKKYHEDLIILESEKVIKFALNRGIYLEELVTNKDFFLKNENLKADKVYLIEKQELNNLIGYKSHSGTFAVVPKPREKQIKNNRVIILDGLTSPENVGSICRSARAFGFDNIIYSNKGITPYLRRCIRVSTGHVLGLNVIKSLNLLKTVQNLKDDGFKILSAHNSKSSLNVEGIEIQNHKIALIVGSEGHGISNDLIDMSDMEIKINTHTSVDHLNVSNASSILMFYLKHI